MLSDNSEVNSNNIRKIYSKMIPQLYKDSNAKELIYVSYLFPLANGQVVDLRTTVCSPRLQEHCFTNNSDVMYIPAEARNFNIMEVIFKTYC